MREQYLCYTDGACKKSKDTPGGWGVFIKTPEGDPIERSGSAVKTSIAAMELTAIGEALQELPPKAKAVIFSDSQSALNTCSIQIPSWKRNNWLSCKDSNLELLKKIDSLISEKALHIEWTWLRSHNGNPSNERADELAAEGARRAKKLLERESAEPEDSSA